MYPSYISTVWSTQTNKHLNDTCTQGRQCTSTVCATSKGWHKGVAYHFGYSEALNFDMILKGTKVGNLHWIMPSWYIHSISECVKNNASLVQMNYEDDTYVHDHIHSHSWQFLRFFGSLLQKIAVKTIFHVSLFLVTRSNFDYIYFSPFKIFFSVRSVQFNSKFGRNSQ